MPWPRDFDVVTDCPPRPVPPASPSLADPARDLVVAAEKSAFSAHRLRNALNEMVNIYWEDGTPAASQPVVIRQALDALRAAGHWNPHDDLARPYGE